METKLLQPPSKMAAAVNKFSAGAGSRQFAKASTSSAAGSQKMGGAIPKTGRAGQLRMAGLVALSGAPKTAQKRDAAGQKRQGLGELVGLMQKQQKLKKAAGDPEAQKKIQEEEEETTNCLEAVGKVIFNHGMLYVSLIIYAFIGAAIFEYTEEANEIASRTALLAELNASAANLTAAIVTLEAKGGDREKAILRLVTDFQRDAELFPKDKLNWDFWGALFFSGTIFTTIGYGHYFPVTRWGRLATMFYAVIGIPLVLSVLSDLGKVLTRLIKRLINLPRRLWRWRDRKRWAAETGDSASYLEWMDSDELDIPVLAAIAIFIGWIFLCSFVFCIWESNWDYFTAFYFFFISLTTIGLGDVVPDHPRYMIFGCGFVIVGLSLISMLINVIQIKMERLKESAADYLEEELGWDTESENSSGDEDEPRGPTATLGIFSSGSTALVDDPEAKAKAAAALHSKKKAAHMWKHKARVEDLRIHRRRRRGAQTDDSYLREIHHKFPNIPYLQIPEMDLIRSRDDINSLIETLE